MDYTQYRPTAILKFYQRLHGEGVYIEMHTIREQRGKLVESAGRPLTLSAYKKLIMLAGKDNVHKEQRPFDQTILDPRILAFDARPVSRFICWYDKAKIRTIKLSDNTEYTVWLPAILYYVSIETLHIYALKTNQRPNLTTELFQYPVPNLKSESNFCWGNVNTEKKIDGLTIDQEMKTWEEMVWGSYFDHYNDNFTKEYRKIEKTDKRYPRRLLKPANKNLKNLMEL
jgi:PRTRC genetic system protein B